MRTPAVILVAWALGGTSGQAAEPPMAPPAVPWKALHFEARKLVLSATSVVRSEVVPAGSLAHTLREPPETMGVPLPAWVVQVSVETDLPGKRREQVRVWLDPNTFAALQTHKRTFGKRPYEKVFRYVTGGYFEWRRAPVNEREGLLPPQAWSDLREGWTGSSEVSAATTVLTDPYALLYLASAAQLHRPGRSFTASIASRGRLVELTFADGGLTQKRVDYLERWPGGERRRRTEALVRLLTVSAAGSAGDRGGERVELGFLGMQDGLVITLDAASGIPVELFGRTHAVGSLVVRLTRADLALPSENDAVTDTGDPPPAHQHGILLR